MPAYLIYSIRAGAVFRCWSEHAEAWSENRDAAFGMIDLV
jgi:hypothetical protein